MSKVISVVSGKGGTGKSTVSIGIAVSLAKRNKSVLLVDLDIGLRSLDIMLGAEDRVVYDIGDIFDGRCSIEKAIVKLDKDLNISLISAPFNVSKDFDIVQVANLITTIRSKYDYVIIDNSAGIGTGVFMACTVSDLAIAVTTPDMVSVRDASKVIRMIASKSKTAHNMIINKIDAMSMQLSGFENLDEVIDMVASPLLGVIPTDISVTLSEFQLDSKYNSSVSVRVFNNITSRIEGTYVPLLINSVR